MKQQSTVSPIAEAEIDDLEDQKKAAQLEAKEAADRMKELASAVKNMEKLAREFSDDPEQILPEPGALESAKGYREKKAKPLLERIVKVLRSVYHAFLNLRNDYDRLQQRFSRECAKTARMGDRIDELADENKILRGIAADFDRAKKALGNAAKFPDLCQQTDDDEQGGLRFEIDKSRISIRLTAPYSPDKKAKLKKFAKAENLT